MTAARAGDARLRHAIKSSTSWWVTVRYAKRGRTRVVPLDDDALEAIVAWVKSRPTAATEHLLLSLPRAGEPGLLGDRDIARIVARHAEAADLPEDRRSPHVLRHTFCTHLADSDADTRSFASSPATPTSAPPPSTPPSVLRALSTPWTSVGANDAA